MEEHIREIIDSDSAIKSGGYFDSHFVIETLLRDERYTADYVRYVALKTGDQNSVADAHGQLALLVKAQDDLVEPVTDGKSFSRDIHGHIYPCELWRKK